ncbi:MAG TPA: low molecular weight phosphatase family protein [Cytophagales bacterium]|jgi:protein-tyrosine phosphatase|nr:low molecular weight phosphatase family protein [Cytophagales bacterium]
MTRKKVLFLCTGNYYRSRFAEIVLNHFSTLSNSEWRALSRGLKANNPANVGKISPHTLVELNKLNIPIPYLLDIPRKVSQKEFEGADKIIALKEEEHKPIIEKNFEKWAKKVEYWDIDDVDVESPKKVMPGLYLKIVGLANELGIHSGDLTAILRQTVAVGVR